MLIIILLYTYLKKKTIRKICTKLCSLKIANEIRNIPQKRDLSLHQIFLRNAN